LGQILPNQKVAQLKSAAASALDYPGFGLATLPPGCGFTPR
jgi:hypothetical protein